MYLNINMRNSLRIVWITIFLMVGLGNVVLGATPKENLPEPLVQKDFSLGFINLGENFDKIKNVFEPPLVMVDRKIWGADGLYHTTWEGTDIKIVVTEYPDMIRTSRVSVLTNQYCTPRGVKVGDSIDDINRVYGEPHHISTGSQGKGLSYNQQGKFNPYITTLYFLLDCNSGIIKSISLFDAMAE